ncbi:hypothetical protein IE077_004219 [Cardiosporidium cionae]|uniref:Uncharacterized protein n=1 Tax=Cardiosporidium cionae TaxID=476202 RepID=A0ABQ7JGC0_9APIC|nr:hypothetical protein IE077_004219 [Cardiosporidium cionae]|eukprot:KAF8823044.1 hypothetical protein IE077_004219 [Cardiosporidium cionae]
MRKFHQALKSCNSLSVKRPDLLICQALAALSLVRSDRQLEALDICANLEKNPLVDGKILDYIEIVYKDASQC